MKKTLLLFVIALTFCITGCKRDTPDFPPIVSTSDSYQPVTQGSYWKYSGVISGVTLTQTTTMTGASEKIGGRLFYVGNTVAGVQSANSYYYHANGKYILRSSTVASGVTVEYLYLIDNMAVGQKWTAPVSDNGMINGVPAQIIGEIMETGINKKVSGKTFTNVVHTKMLFQYNLTGAMETVQILDFYIAKGVGIIQMDSSSFGLESSTTISSYSVK